MPEATQTLERPVEQEEAQKVDAPTTESKTKKERPLGGNPPPRLAELIKADIQERLNPIKKEGHLGSFTEGKAIYDMLDFCDRVESFALETKNIELLKKAISFRENAVFIGQEEFNKATDAMAERLIEVSDVQPVIVFRKDKSDESSDTYITTIVMEKMEKATEGKRRPHPIHIATTRREVAEAAAKYGPGKVKILLFDDVVLSGGQMAREVIGRNTEHTFWGHTLKDSVSVSGELIRSLGWSETEAKDAIEADVVAAQKDHMLRTKLGMNFYSYYDVPTYDADKERYGSEISVSSFYSSSDYGWENIIYSLKKRVQCGPQYFQQTARPLAL